MTPPATLFSSTGDRITRARDRYFGEGLMPTGMVSDAIFESWSRCLRLHHRPASRAEFQPVTHSRTQLSLQRNRPLHQVWQHQLPALETMLAPTTCAAMLTDPSGVLIGSACAGRAHEALMPIATRLGVNLSEEAVGTTAPGVASRTGKAVVVLAGEHFFESVKAMHCAAAPIHGVDGQVAGVLDLSSECIPFSFDAAAVVAHLAAALEKHLLLAQSVGQLVLRFQLSDELLDSPLAGLVGVDTTGRMSWANASARRLLGISMATSRPALPDPQDAFGCSLTGLLALQNAGSTLLTLHSGLRVRARCRIEGEQPMVRSGPSFVSAATLASASAPVRERVPDQIAPAHHPSTVGPVTATDGEVKGIPKATLREADNRLIERVLRDLQGNVARAARQLGVSRGLIYRRLRAMRASADLLTDHGVPKRNTKPAPR